MRALPIPSSATACFLCSVQFFRASEKISQRQLMTCLQAGMITDDDADDVSNYGKITEKIAEYELSPSELQFKKEDYKTPWYKSERALRALIDDHSDGMIDFEDKEVGSSEETDALERNRRMLMTVSNPEIPEYEFSSSRKGTRWSS
ncbi:hypothetical protein E2562_001788 [Oryza meyeriana var. granulata]|uniref:Uncharacterized protein n=1 Tax=Oryza meyeriana var. granulata TaxID=110450 RepID=A0A6G1CDB7_9ORYZ|nr:hypothetical protein E2562_001788 [Oryza meyeriana var. granulata]